MGDLFTFGPIREIGNFIIPSFSSCNNKRILFCEYFPLQALINLPFYFSLKFLVSPNFRYGFPDKVFSGFSKCPAPGVIHKFINIISVYQSHHLSICIHNETIPFLNLPEIFMADTF